MPREDPRLTPAKEHNFYTMGWGTTSRRVATIWLSGGGMIDERGIRLARDGRAGLAPLIAQQTVRDQIR
jgi:hypothetical protein